MSFIHLNTTFPFISNLPFMKKITVIYMFSYWWIPELSELGAFRIKLV